MFPVARAVLLSMREREDFGSIYTHISVVITRERWRDSTIHEIRHLFCHATTTGHRVRFVDGLPGASLPPEPDALHKSLTFYLLVFCSSDAVAV